MSMQAWGDTVGGPTHRSCPSRWVPSHGGAMRKPPLDPRSGAAACWSSPRSLLSPQVLEPRLWRGWAEKEGTDCRRREQSSEGGREEREGREGREGAGERLRARAQPRGDRDHQEGPPAAPDHKRPTLCGAPTHQNTATGSSMSWTL